VFLSVEHPLFVVQYAYTILTHFLSETQFDVPEYVEFKKRLWNYLGYFDWLDVYWYVLSVDAALGLRLRTMCQLQLTHMDSTQRQSKA
jgi:hypothetical protein